VIGTLDLTSVTTGLPVYGINIFRTREKQRRLFRLYDPTCHSSIGRVSSDPIESTYSRQEGETIVDHSIDMWDPKELCFQPSSDRVHVHTVGLSTYRITIRCLLSQQIRPFPGTLRVCD
jgi:hypothetical protein